MNQKNQIRSRPVINGSRSVLIGAWFLLNALNSCLALDLPTTEVPFELHGHLIIVKGAVSDLDDLNFVVDTGSSRTLLDLRIAEKLGLHGEPVVVSVMERKVQIRRSFIPELRIGDLTHYKVPVWIGEVSLRRMDRPIRIDGLIGLDLMRRTNLSINFATMKITFGPAPHSSSQFSFYGKLPFVPVPFYIRDQRFILLLDTGSGHIILYRDKVEGRISSIRKTKERKRLQHVGGAVNLKRIVVETVRISDSQWEYLSAYLLDGRCSEDGPDGVLGIASLGLEVLNLDFERNIVSWE